MADTQIVIQIAGINYPIFFLDGDERLSQHYQFTVKFIASSLTLACLDLVTIAMRKNGQVIRQIDGIAVTINSSFHTLGTCYELLVKPRLYLLSYMTCAKTYLNMTVIEVLKVLLRQAGYETGQWHFHFSIQQQPLDYLQQLPYENCYQFLLRVLAKKAIFFWFDSDPQHGQNIHFADSDDYCFNMKPFDYQFSLIETSTEPMERFYACQSQYQLSFVGKICPILQMTSHELSFAPGYRLQLARSYLTAHYQDCYLITQVTHRARWSVVDDTHHIDYQATVTLCRRENIEDCLPEVQYPLPVITTAVVESLHDQATLNEKGEQHFLYHFIVKPALKMNNSLATKKLSCYGQGDRGMHFPLQDGCEVLVGYSEDDIQAPIILGALNNASHPSPVTDKNPSVYMLQSHEGNLMAFDSHPQQAAIHFNTKGGKNLLRLDQSQADIIIHSLCGSLLFNCGGQLQLKAAADLQLIVKDSAVMTVTEGVHYSIRGELIMHSGTLFILKSHDNLALQSNKNIVIQSQQHCQFIAERDLNIKTLQGDITMTSLSSQLDLNSSKNLQIVADEQIVITSGDTTIVMADNSLTINGDTIEFAIEQAISCKGECDYH